MLYDLSLASEHGRFACVNTVTPKLWLFRKIVRKKCLHPKESHHWLYYIWLSSLASHASIQAKTTKTFTIVLLLFDSFSIETPFASWYSMTWKSCWGHPHDILRLLISIALAIAATTFPSVSWPQQWHSQWNQFGIKLPHQVCLPCYAMLIV